MEEKSIAGLLKHNRYHFWLSLWTTIFQRLRANTLRKYLYHLPCLYAFSWTSAINYRRRQDPWGTGYKNIRAIILGQPKDPPEWEGNPPILLAFTWGRAALASLSSRPPPFWSSPTQGSRDGELSGVRHQRIHAGWDVWGRGQRVLPSHRDCFCCQVSGGGLLPFPNSTHAAPKPCLWRQKRGRGSCHANVTFYEQDNCSKKGFFLLFFFFFGKLSTHGLGLRAPRLLHHTAQKWTLQISVGGQPWQRSQREEKQPVL